MKIMKAIMKLTKAVIYAAAFVASAGFCMAVGMGIVMCIAYQF